MRVSEVMAHPAITCPVDTALDAPARLMWEFDCGIILVVGDDGRLVGVVTDRDICLGAYMHHQPLNLIPLGKVMSRPVISVHEGDDLTAAEHVLRDNRIRRLPVTDDQGRPVGVVSLHDVARTAVRTGRADHDREIVETVAAVSSSRESEGSNRPLVPTK